MGGRYVVGVLVFAVCALAAAPAFSLPAFPGAEGGGSDTVGGRGGQIVEVTNLNDNGPGSLRAACAASGPRIVVFRVGGMIELDSPIEIQDPYITIAGQTAPGDGICIKASSNMPTTAAGLIDLYTHDVVVRYLRFRLGDAVRFRRHKGCNIQLYAWSWEGVDYYSYNAVFDHCSFSWCFNKHISIWGDLGVPQNYDISTQWCIMSEALDVWWSTAFLAGTSGDGIEHTEMVNIDCHHNYFAHNTHRVPGAKVWTSRMINNLAYNWRFRGAVLGGGMSADLIGNEFRDGPDSLLDRYEVHWWDTEGYQPSDGFNIYLQRNMGHNCPDPSGDNWPMLCDSNSNPVDRSHERLTEMPPADNPITEHSVYDLQDMFINSSQTAGLGAGACWRLDENGAWVWMRDAVDDRVLQDCIDLDGNIIQSPSEVGGYPVYNDGTPYPDTDHDGMSDTWENAKFGGLSRTGTGDADGDGYTDVEEFLNGTDPGGGGPAPPVAEFSGTPRNGPAPLTVYFTDLSTGDPTSWDWTFGDGGTSPDQHPSHEYTAADTYTVSLTAYNAQGQDTETKVDYITATQPQPPVADFEGSPLSGPAPLTVDFTDLSTNSPTAWDWTFGDGGTSPDQHPSHEYTAADTYTVSLTAYNAQGQDTETKPDYITVTSGDQSCHVGDITMSQTGQGANNQALAVITVHDQDHQPLAGVTVDATWTDPGGTWSDSRVTGPDGTADFYSHKFKQSGTYTICVDDLTLTGYPYQPADNHETCDSITLP